MNYNYFEVFLDWNDNWLRFISPDPGIIWMILLNVNTKRTPELLSHSHTIITSSLCK